MERKLKNKKFWRGAQISGGGGGGGQNRQKHKGDVKL